MATGSNKQQRDREVKRTAPRGDQAPTEESFLDSAPDPVMPRRGRAGIYATARFVANPKLNGSNPRRPGTNGYKMFEIVNEAGTDGISYEELKAKVSQTDEIVGFGNHLRWDLAHHFILALDSEGQIMAPPAKSSAVSGLTPDEDAGEAADHR